MLKNIKRQLQDEPSMMRIAELGYLKKVTNVCAIMMLMQIQATSIGQQLITRY
jgi:hypothetical protein